MKSFCTASAAILLACPLAGIAQFSGTCAAPFEVPLASGSTLSIESRSGQIDVVGVGGDSIRISCTLRDSDDAKYVRIGLVSAGDNARLKFKGGPNNDAHFRVEVPHKTSLWIRMPAGQVNVDHVEGNKDIEILAGEINVSHVDASEYRSIEATAEIGEVNSPVFGIDKGGFFRTFRKEVPGGQYRLRIHVSTGSVALR